MKFEIDEKTLQTYIEETVNKKVDQITDEIIEDKIYKLLFNKVDGIFARYSNDIRHCVNVHVREIIKERVPELDKELLDKIGKGIANNIAYKLKENIIESIAYCLMPEENESEED